MSRMLQWVWDRANFERRGQQVRRKRCPLGVERLEDRCLLSASTPFTSVGIGGGGMLGSIAINPMNGQDMYMSTDMVALYHTNNANTTGGTSWTISNPYQGGVYAKNYQQVQYTNVANVQYVYNPVGLASNGDGYDDGVPMVTTNDGTTWTQMPTPSGADLTQLIADPHNDNQVFAIGKGGSIWFTQNGTAGAAATWTQIASPTSGWGGPITWSAPAGAGNGGAQYVGGIFSNPTDKAIFLSSNFGLVVGLSNGSGGYTWSLYGGSQAGGVAGLPSGDGLFSLTGATNYTTGDTYLYAVAEPMGALAVNNTGAFDNGGWGTTLTNNNIYSLEVVAGGGTNLSNNNSWTQLAALPNDTSSISYYNGAIGVPLRITAQAAYSSPTDNATLYVGGTFDSLDGFKQLPPAVFMSSNSGASWTSLFSSTGSNVNDGPIGYPWADDWSWGQGANVTGISYFQNNWSSTNTGEIAISTSAGAYMTMNNGSTWTTIAQANSQAEGVETPHVPYQSTVNPIATYFTGFGLNSDGTTNNNYLLQGTQDNGLLYSTDGGVHWATAKMGVNPNVGGIENYADYNDSQTGQWYVAVGGDLGWGKTNNIDDNGGGIIYNNGLGTNTWQWFMNTKTVLPTPAWAASNPSEYGGSVVKSVTIGNNGNAMYTAVDDNAATSSGEPLGGIWATNLLGSVIDGQASNLNSASDWVRLPDPTVGWGPAQGDTANRYPFQVVSIDANDIVVTYGADTDSGMANRAGVFLGHITWSGNTPTVTWTDITPNDGTSSNKDAARTDATMFTVDPNNPNIWFVGSASTGVLYNGQQNAGLWESTSGLNTTSSSWTESLKSPFGVYDVAIDPGVTGGMYASVINGGLYYSPSDTNVSWTRDTAYPFYDPMQIRFNDSNNTLWVTSGGAGTMVTNFLLTSTAVNVPSASPAGSANFDPSTGTYTVEGSGDDIQGAADQFQFANESYTGNGVVYAEVTGITKVSGPDALNGWAKAGVMWRANNSPTDGGAINATIHASASNHIEFSWRSTANGSTSTAETSGSYTPTASNPIWVELVRQGNTFTAYYAFGTTLPTTWTQLGSAVTLSGMPTTAYVGLAVTAHDVNDLVAGTFQNFDPSPLPGATSGANATTTNGSNGDGGTATGPTGLNTVPALPLLGSGGSAPPPPTTATSGVVLDPPASGGNTSTPVPSVPSNWLFSSPRFLDQLRTSLLMGKRLSDKLTGGWGD